MNNTKRRRQTTAEIALDKTRKKKIIRSMPNGLASFLGITTGIISPIVDSATSLWQKISIRDANYVQREDIEVITPSSVLDGGDSDDDKSLDEYDSDCPEDEETNGGIMYQYLKNIQNNTISDKNTNWNQECI